MIRHLVGEAAVALGAVRSKIPTASGTTIIGIAAALGVASGIVLRWLGYPEEAGLAVSAAWAIIHPEVNRSVPVAEMPPHAPLPAAHAPGEGSGAS